MSATDTDLAARLAQAQEAERPLAQRVNTLQRQLAEASERQEFTAAEDARVDLDSARQDHAIAAATTQALAQAIGVIDQQRAEDARALQLQQQRAAAERTLAECVEQDQAIADELERHVAELWAGLDAVRRTIVAAMGIEHAGYQVRLRANEARSVLGEPVGRVEPPNRMSALTEQDPLIRAVYQRQA